jgi:V8-like Glu-specific endopeptidase
MRRSLWKRGSVAAAAALAVAATAAIATPSSAEPAPAAPAPVISVATNELASTPESARTVAQFWTPDRMRAAVPLDQLLVDLPQNLLDVAKGTPTLTPPTLPSLPVPAAFPQPGGAWTGGGAITKTAGRVFFTYQGRQASCSGDAVTSGNRSTVITAGHCVKLEGAWHTDWVFVPGYDNGNTPFGTWTASKTLTTPQWEASEDINFDVGAAVVNQLDGKFLTDVVGGQGIAFNQARGQDMYAFGYPAADPYDGSKLIYCSGTAFDDFLLSQDLGLTCNMTGGSSGGPWFLTFDEAAGTGVQNSVNSFKYNFMADWMFGPYFGADAEALYNTASSS